jgi:hypothetical protein
MFERFTDRARRILVLAQEDARSRNHNYIGTEHIALGLLVEGEGVAAKALQQVGVNIDALRDDIVSRMGARQGPATEAPPFTPKAKRALELSLGEALKLGHNYIGTEHLLLGLMAEGAGIAAQALAASGATSTDLRRVVVELLAGDGLISKKAMTSPPSTTTARTVGDVTPAVDVTLRGARARAGQRPIGTHDLLAAILYSDRSAAVTALANAGFVLDDLRAAVANASTLDTSDQTPEEAVARQVDVRVAGERIVITVEDTTLLAAFKAATPDATAGLTGTNPRVAHDLGNLWQQVHAILGTAVDRLAKPPLDEPGR